MECVQIFAGSDIKAKIRPGIEANTECELYLTTHVCHALQSKDKLLTSNGHCEEGRGQVGMVSVSTTGSSCLCEH